MNKMNLVDHFLVAMPAMEDPFFEKSVVYICQHDKEGAMGIVINKPSPVMMSLIFNDANINIPKKLNQDWIMMGGPVQLDRGYVIHSPVGSWQNSFLVNDNIALTTSRDVIESLAKPDVVNKAIISIGYASWQAGQLEQELAQNTWLTVPADEHILFDLPYAERYEATFAKIGIHSYSLMQGAGHA